MIIPEISLVFTADIVLHVSFLRNPIEVTEDFIQQFNAAKDFTEKEEYEERARKLLERAKVGIMKNHFAYKIKSFSRIDLPFGGHHICVIHGVPGNLVKISSILSMYC